MGYRSVVIVLLSCVVLLGSMASSSPSGKTEPSAPKSDALLQKQSEAVEQLKEISAQLKELNAMLRSGKARVGVLVNVDAKPETSK